MLLSAEPESPAAVPLRGEMLGVTTIALSSPKKTIKILPSNLDYIT